MAWQVQEAKQRLSEVLRAAEESPQVITRHGHDVAVVIDIAQYRRLVGIEVDFTTFLRHGPAADGLELRRDTAPARVIDLDESADVR
jgi:prevent-host-death family protein